MPNTLEWRREVRLAVQAFIEDVITPGERFETADIYDYFSTECAELCDDSIPCQCRGRRVEEPEWRHYVRFAIEDSKRRGIIERAKPSGWVGLKTPGLNPPPE